MRMFSRVVAGPIFVVMCLLVMAGCAGNHPTIGLRLSAHPLCRALCDSFGGAIVSTSANPSYREPAKTPTEVTDYFGAALCGTLEGELGGDGRPSEIRDLASGQVLRQG